MENKFIVKDSGKREHFNTGCKRDIRTEKGRYDLIPPYSLRRLALVYERGAVKYDDNNWMKGMPISRCIDSALRHIDEYKMGMIDEDHVAQAAWNLFSVMHYQEMIDKGILPKELDDMYKYKK